MPTLDDDWLHGNAPPKDAFIAFFDVLGWKKIVRNQDIRSLTNAFRALQLKIEDEVAKEARGFEWGGIEDPTHENIRVAFVSDSLLLYTYEDSGRCLSNLIHASIKTMVYAVQHNIALRGCITRGELFVSDDLKTALGEGLIRAYELEQSTKWMGAIIDTDRLGRRPREWNSLLNAATKGHVWFYDPPIKEDHAHLFECRHLTLGWPYPIGNGQCLPGGGMYEIMSETGNPYMLNGRDFIAAYWSDAELEHHRLNGLKTQIQMGEPLPPYEPARLPQYGHWAELAETTGFPPCGVHPNDLGPWQSEDNVAAEMPIQHEE